MFHIINISLLHNVAAVVLFILKLIGIILASILGLLILLLLVVLLVPIRYQIKASNTETVQADARISWLLRILNVRITYMKNKFVTKIFIFGRIFYASDKPKQKIKKRTKQAGKKVEKQVKKDIEKQVDKQIKQDVEKQLDKNIDRDVNQQAHKEVNQQADNQAKSIDTIQSDKQYTDKTEHQSGTQTIGREESPSDIKSDSNKTKKIKHKNIFVKLKDIVLAIKVKLLGIKDSIIGIKKKLIGIKESIIGIINKLIGMKDLWCKYKTFLQNDRNKAGIKHLFRSIMDILKHMGPRKLSAAIEFGTGDPCSTGQALGVLAVLYGYYGEAVQITPNFDTQVLKGNLFCRGRIRLFTLLIICIKLILDKNFRKVIKNYKALQEEL